MKNVVLVMMLAMLCGVASADTLTVCASGCDHTTIQAAEDAAVAGDTVYVYNGTYTENIDVGNASVSFVGEGRDVVTVQAANTGDDVFDVQADHVNISGFTVTGAVGWTSYGIFVGGPSYCNISYNNASGNWVGIRLSTGNDNTVGSNRIAENSHQGLVILNTRDSTIADNLITGNGYEGIWLSSFSERNTVIGNSVVENSWSGIMVTIANNNDIVDNNLSGNAQYGMYLATSDDNVVSNNTVIGNGWQAFLIGQASNTIISKNNVVAADGYCDYTFLATSPPPTVNNTIRDPANVENSIKMDAAAELFIENTDSGVFTEDSSAETQAYPNGNFSLQLSGVTGTFHIVQRNMSVLPTSVLTVNATTLTEPVKRYNESAAADVYALYTVGAADANTTYVVNVFADANGSKMQTFRIKSNSTGFITYNTTGYGYDRWTEIKPATEPPGTLVVIAVCGAVLFGGGWAIRRWVRKS